MEVIKRKICIRDFQDRRNPYSNTCLTGVTNGEFSNTCITTTSGSTWHYGSLTGYTESGEILSINNSITLTESGNNLLMENGFNEIMETNCVTLATIPILFTRTFDDIGVTTDFEENFIENKVYYSGETVIFNDISYRCKEISCSTTNNNFISSNYFEIKHVVLETGHTVSFVGESKIDEFRRYSKNDEDKDLYNPVWNTGYTFYTTNDNGTRNKITSESTNYNGSKQNLYSYIIGYDQGFEPTTGIHYSDNKNGKSDISYNVSGLTVENSISAPNIKEEYLVGVVEPVKVSIDVNIDRGKNSSFDKHLKLGEIRTLDDFISYGNGYFNIKE